MLSTVPEALVSAMRRRGTRPLVAITGLRAGDSHGHGGVWLDRVLRSLLPRKVYADKDRQEAIVAGSGLDWVTVRPAVLNDKLGRGGIRALLDLGGVHGGTPTWPASWSIRSGPTSILAGGRRSRGGRYSFQAVRLRRRERQRPTKAASSSGLPCGKAALRWSRKAETRALRSRRLG